MEPMEIVDLQAKLDSFSTRWEPKIVAELNGQQVKLVKLLGEFVWHSHEREDELFLVLAGELAIQFRDRTETVRPGQLIVVPRGVEHCPRADEEVHLLLFEPASTVNTGTAGGERTVTGLERI